MSEPQGPLGIDWYSGEQSPARAAVLADDLAEIMRALNLATKIEGGGLSEPSDVHRMLGYLHTATARLPQLLGQLHGFVVHQRGRLRHDQAGDDQEVLDESVVRLYAATAEGRELAEQLSRALQRAQNEAGHLALGPVGGAR